MTKDITYNVIGRTEDSSQVDIYYGSKKITSCIFWDDDISDLKLAIAAVQAEILKDAMKAPPTVIYLPAPLAVVTPQPSSTPIGDMP